jgi:trans-2,3-dihydro-3-hydroxyanthranilate isomerase
MMQTLAREINFSETTFVTSRDATGYTLRIFTAASELPFAGHPTLGTAFTLASQGLVPADLTQHCAAGDIPVRVDLAAGTASMRQLAPVFGAPVNYRAAVARAAGLEPEDLVEELPVMSGSSGIAHLMVPVRDEETLRRAQRRGAACSSVCGAADVESLYLFAVQSPGHVMARMFDRWDSVGEDPATGSAAGPLGAYLAQHALAGMPGRVVVSQGELIGRPSSLVVDVAADGDSWRVDVGGGVHIVGEGFFTVPD